MGRFKNSLGLFGSGLITGALLAFVISSTGKIQLPLAFVRNYSTVKMQLPLAFDRNYSIVKMQLPLAFDRNYSTVKMQLPLTFDRTFQEPIEMSKSGNPEMQFLRQHGHPSALPSEQEIKNLSSKELYYMYHSYLDNIDVVCQRKIRMGKVDDGGWELCDDYEYRPIQPCVVYSFGINRDFSFDDEVGRLYGCQVISFDPSMDLSTHKRSDKVYFYNIGLKGSSSAKLWKSSWRMETFSGIRTMLKHTTVDIVKMDIENSEWLALPDMIAKGELNHVRQLFVECHTPSGDDGKYRYRLSMLASLQRQGFKKFYTHMNPRCGIQEKDMYLIKRTGCYEMYFVNTRFVRKRQ